MLHNHSTFPAYIFVTSDFPINEEVGRTSHGHDKLNNI